MADDDFREVTKRTVNTQDLSWILEHNRRGQLDLDPPYQRRSVWTPRDRRSFMDTVFKNYPSPPVYLHKTINLDSGKAMFHVVDGKQRISTVLDFLNNKVYLPHEFGDERLNGKRWRDLIEDDKARASLWNYRIIVEEIDDVSPAFVREVFERLNKNSRKLTPQELRHARFDGWLITFLEEELAQPVWRKFKIQTTGKEKRMTDVQNLAELAMVTERGTVSGFDQTALDEFFARLDDVGDDLDDESQEFDTDAFASTFRATRDSLDTLDRTVKAREPGENEEEGEIPGVVSTFAQPFMHFYTLWSYMAMSPDLSGEEVAELGYRYRAFMELVNALDLSDDVPEVGDNNSLSLLAARYKTASTGATTEEPKRLSRLNALREAVELPTIDFR